MKKFPLIAISLTLIIFVGGIFLLSGKSDTSENNTPPPLPSSYEYFWGDGCSHCAKVAEFLDGWEGKDKIAIDKKEVWSNKENLKLMQERATYCGLNKNSIGVPFLFTPDGKCLIGDEPIIELLKSLNTNS